MTKRLITHILGACLILMVFVTPQILFAAHAANGDFIKCDTDCDYNHLVQLIQDSINGLIKLSTLAAASVFAFAGFKLLTAQGKSGELDKAKEMFVKVLKGYGLVLIAWLLVYTITSQLLKDGYSLLGNP